MKFFGVIVACLSTSACASLGSRSLIDSPQLTLTLERAECMIECPVYTLKVFPDRDVLFSGTRWDHTQGEDVHSISEEQHKQILVSLRNASFEKLKDRYISAEDGCSEVWTDHPSLIITISDGSKQKRVEFNYGCQCGSTAEDAERISVLGQEIDSILNSERWIGSPPAGSQFPPRARSADSCRIRPMIGFTLRPPLENAAS